eukprot:scaffold705_cov402-Prasinococcus_capsulatus_cf.AAC.40
MKSPVPRESSVDLTAHIMSLRISLSNFFQQAVSTLPVGWGHKSVFYARPETTPRGYSCKQHALCTMLRAP